MRPRSVGVQGHPPMSVLGKSPTAEMRGVDLRLSEYRIDRGAGGVNTCGKGGDVIIRI